MATAEQRQKPWVEALREELGDAVSSEPQDLQAHGNDEGYRYENRPPECVAYARNKEDVVSVLRVKITAFCIFSMFTMVAWVYVKKNYFSFLPGKAQRPTFHVFVSQVAAS